MPNRMSAAFAWLIAAGLAAAPAAAQSIPSPVAIGKELYNDRCAQCHQVSGAGGEPFGSVVSANLQAPGLEKTYHNSDQLILRAHPAGGGPKRRPAQSAHARLARKAHATGGDGHRRLPAHASFIEAAAAAAVTP